MKALRFAALCVVIGVLPACSQHQKTIDMGLKRITLDLAFKNAAKAAKPTITQFVQLQEPVGASGQLLGDLARPVITPSVAPSPLCGVAPKGALPATPVAGVPGKPPASGLYLRHNKGTFDLDGGGIKLKGPFPIYDVMEIGNVTDVTTLDATGGRVRTITYDVIVRNLIATTTTTYQSVVRDVYRSAAGTSAGPLANELDLVKAETKTSTGTQTFHPTPPVTLMQYGGEGAVWKSAGTDEATGTTMVVQGTIAKREAVDVCGTPIDTFRVESTEQVTNPISGYSSQTKSDDPNVYNVATQFGGLVVQQHVDTTTTFAVASGTATLVIDNTSTVDSVTPKAKS